jgi:CRP-like cAMP-binding protein
MTNPQNVHPAPPACATCPVNLRAIYGKTQIDIERIAGLRRDFLALPAGSMILREGVEKDVFFTLRSGWAFRYKPMAEGGRAILGFVLPGDPIALPLLWGSELHYFVRALTDVELCVFKREDMSKLVRARGDMFESFACFLTREAVASDERYAECGRLSAKERVARLLLYLYFRMAGCSGQRPETIEFPLRQHHIADAIGVTPVHVSRVMTELRREGVVRIDSKSLTVLDLPTLRHFAGTPTA